MKLSEPQIGPHRLLLGGDSGGQVELAAGALLAQIDHALQLVVRAEAPAALVGVVEGRRLRSSQRIRSCLSVPATSTCLTQGARAFPEASPAAGASKSGEWCAP